MEGVGVMGSRLQGDASKRSGIEVDTVSVSHAVFAPRCLSARFITLCQLLANGNIHSQVPFL